MQNITGKIAFGGIAIGKIKEISKENNVVRRVKIEDAKAEIARFEAARDQAAEELKGLYDKAVKEVGEANAAIFEVHQMMLEDEDYLDSVRNIIEAQSVNAEFAVATTGSCATLSVDFAPELPELWHLPVSVLQILTISD